MCAMYGGGMMPGDVARAWGVPNEPFLVLQRVAPSEPPLHALLASQMARRTRELRPGREIVPSRQHLPALLRRLTPMQGLDLVLPFAEVCELLSEQLEEPERLRPRQEVPCRADIFASAGDASWLDIVSAIHSDLQSDSSVAPLTPRLADRLGLQAFLTSPAPVLSLLITEDPTYAPEVAPWAPEIATATQTRLDVPARFANDWDYVRSRKEAVAIARKARRRARSWWGRLLARFSSSRLVADHAIWKRRLSGRPLDEQLWAVRPTKRLLLDADARRSVRGALALGGYDVHRMLNEWEIHWRRKGI